MSGDASKEDTTGILSRNSGLTGWRKAIRRVASLEDTALADIDETYDGLVPKAEQEEWLHEKLRQLREEASSITTSQHSGLKSRWEVLDRFKTKKIASAERQKNRQIESIKNMFESELLHATEECAADKKNYQSELSDMFSRRIRKLEEDLKVLETEGSLDNVKPQPARKVRVRRGGPGGGDGEGGGGGGKRSRVAPFQNLMENGSSLTEEERADDFGMVQRLANQIGAS